MKILNLTQHKATKAQKEAGVIEPDEELKRRIKELITFQSIPSTEEMRKRVRMLSKIVKERRFKAAMLGGASYFMPPLVEEMHKEGIKTLFAFTKREAVEKRLDDNTVQTVYMFNFKGFVEL